MTRSSLLACGLSGTLAAAAFAGPLNKAWVAPDSKWVVHVDMDALRTSTVGTFIAEHRKELELTGLDAFKCEVGLDPWSDLKGVTVYGTTPDPNDGVAIVTASAAVDDALAKLLKKEKGVKAISEDGVALYTWTEHGTERFGYVQPGAKADERVVLAAVSKPLLLRAIKQLNKPDEAAAEAAKESALAATPRSGSVLFVSTTAMGGLHDPAGSMMFQKMEALRLDCGEAAGEMYGELNVTASTSEDATNILQAAQGGLAIARMCAASDPDLKQLMKAVDWVKLSSNEKTVRAVVRCPSADVRALLSSALDKKEEEEGKQKAPAKDAAPAAQPEAGTKKPEPM
jgi:hypothetical protein